LRHEFPSETRFTPEHFGDCSLIEVEQALNFLDRRDVEQANLHAIPISSVGQWIAASKGAKDIDSDWFNPFAALLYQQQAKSEVDPIAARILLQLTGENKVPAWAIAVLDLKLIRAAAQEMNNHEQL
jgi:hypothetical protein